MDSQKTRAKAACLRGKSCTLVGPSGEILSIELESVSTIKAELRLSGRTFGLSRFVRLARDSYGIPKGVGALS